VHDADAMDGRLADVVRRLVGMRRRLRGPDFEALADALHVELDVAEMEAAARRASRRPPESTPGASVVRFPGPRRGGESPDDGP